MDKKEFKNLVKQIDRKIKKIFNGVKYTFLDYEFTANRVIEELDIDEETKRGLRIKFSNKARQMYYEAKNFEEMLMDKFDILGESTFANNSEYIESIAEEVMKECSEPEEELTEEEIEAYEKFVHEFEEEENCSPEEFKRIMEEEVIVDDCEDVDPLEIIDEEEDKDDK